MARHDDDYRFPSNSSRSDRGSHRDAMSGSRAGWRSDDDHDDDRGRGSSYGSGSYGRYGNEREAEGSSRWFGSASREKEGRYGGYEGERGDAYRGGPDRYGDHGGRYGNEYGGSSYGRSSYEHDDMSSGGVAGGGRGYGYGPGNGGDMYRGRGEEQRGSHSLSTGRQRGRHDMGRQSMGSYDAGEQGRGGGWYDDRSGGMSGRSHGSAGRYGSEHAGMGGGYGIGASGQEHHGGKGPKGYARSDDRIKEDVCDCLTDDPMLDAGEIEVQVKNGEVTLTGSVSDRLAKRHAEDMIERVSGVKNVQNSIKVKERDSARHSGTQTGKSSLST